MARPRAIQRLVHRRQISTNQMSPRQAPVREVRPPLRRHPVNRQSLRQPTPARPRLEASRPSLVAVARRRPGVCVRLRQGQHRPVRPLRRLPPVPPPAARQVPRLARELAKAPANKPVNRDRASRRRRTRSGSFRRSRWALRRLPRRWRLPNQPRKPAQRRAPRPRRVQPPAAPAAVQRPSRRQLLAPQPHRQARRPARRRQRRWVRLRRRPRPHPSLSRVRVPAVRVVRVWRRCRPTSSRTPLRRRRSR